jgi:Na+/H+-dicarboxylate symporter
MFLFYFIVTEGLTVQVILEAILKRINTCEMVNFNRQSLHETLVAMGTMTLRH